MPAINPFVLCRRVGVGGAVLLGVSGWSVGSLPASGGMGWWQERGYGMDVLGGTLASVGMVLLVGAWWRMGRLIATGAADADGHPVTARRMSRTLWWWAAPLAVGPPLFSSDVYSYVAQGAMSVHGMNVYSAGPADLGGPLAGDVPAIWQHASAPYGPVFIQLADGVVRLTGENVVFAVLAMRVAALVAVGAMCWAVRSLAQAAGSGASGALWAGVLNPLVLMHLVAGAHNDALMLALMLTGLALARRGHPLWGVVAVSLAMLVKVPAGLALLFIAPLTPGAGGRMWPGTRRALAGLATAAAVTVAVTTLTGLGYGWVLALRTPTSVETLWSISTDIGRLLRWLTSGSASSDRAWGVDPVTLTRSVSLVAAVAAGGYWLRRAPVVGAEFALGMALLTLVALSPVIQPWYVLWGTVPLAVTAWRAMAGSRARAAVIVLVFALLPEGTGPTTASIASALLGVILGGSLLVFLFAGDATVPQHPAPVADFREPGGFGTG